MYLKRNLRSGISGKDEIMLYVIIGKSSTGKDTIYRRLISDKELKLQTITTYTTRPAREGETDGKEYNFVSESEMNRLEHEGRVIERRTYNTVYGEWNYFTVDDGKINLRDEHYLIIGTLESFEKIRNYFGKDMVVPLYIDVEDGERLSRALAREKAQTIPKYAEMCRRYLADEEDFSVDKLTKLGINKVFNNDNVDKCAGELIEEIKTYPNAKNR